MSILKNAVDSILLGLEDYRSTEPRRLVSAVRNLYSGILLLFKHKLALISPVGSDEVLIKSVISPELGESGEITWTGKGKKTVDFGQIKERFESLNIEVDWSRIAAIQQYRNNIEHYYSKTKPEAVKKLISDCFIVISRFVCLELHEDPKSLFGDEEWTFLVSLNEAYQKEKDECIAAIQKTDWHSEVLQTALEEATCSHCGSGLITPKDAYTNCFDAVFRCRICEEEFNHEDMVKDVLDQYEANRAYRHYKDGGGAIRGTCPSCWNETYIAEEEYCPVCGDRGPHMCQRCGMEIPAEELGIDGDYCSWCAHMMSKDD